MSTFHVLATICVKLLSEQSHFVLFIIYFIFIFFLYLY